MTLTTFNPTKLGILDKKNKQKSKSTEEKTEEVM